MTQLTENKQPAPFLIGYSSTFLLTTNTSNHFATPRSKCKFQATTITPYFDFLLTSNSSNHFATPRSKCKFSSPPIPTDVVLVPTLRPAVKWNALQRPSEDRVRHNQ